MPSKKAFLLTELRFWLYVAYCFIYLFDNLISSLAERLMASNDLGFLI